MGGGESRLSERNRTEYMKYQGEMMHGESSGIPKGGSSK